MRPETIKAIVAQAKQYQLGSEDDVQVKDEVGSEPSPSSTSGNNASPTPIEVDTNS